LGPSVVRFFGVLQPVLDGVKLLLKDIINTFLAQIVLLWSRASLILMLFLTILIYVLPWGHSGALLMHYPIIILFVILGLGTYAVMLLGWSFTSPFSKLGGLRGMLQRLSFEVALILVLMVPISFSVALAVTRAPKLGLEMVLWGVLWLSLCLIERNRAPFDLLEGERELIRGFNIEVSSAPFVFVFLREYGILFSLGALLRLGLLIEISILVVLSILTLLFIRRCFPRIRYDTLMGLTWQRVLPLGLTLILFGLTTK
jgi:NADH-quinone oxidoreductase subunit H